MERSVSILRPSIEIELLKSGYLWMTRSLPKNSQYYPTASEDFWR